MPADPTRRDDVLDALLPLGDIHARAMFGGYGLYAGGLFFGLISSGNRLYFKTTSASREPYLARGMEPFEPNTKQTLYRYYEVPPDIQADPDQFCEWANSAIAVARQAAALARPRRTRFKKPLDSERG